MAAIRSQNVLAAYGITACVYDITSRKLTLVGLKCLDI